MRTQVDPDDLDALQQLISMPSGASAVDRCRIGESEMNVRLAGRAATIETVVAV